MHCIKGDVVRNGQIEARATCAKLVTIRLPYIVDWSWSMASLRLRRVEARAVCNLYGRIKEGQDSLQVHDWVDSRNRYEERESIREAYDGWRTRWYQFGLGDWRGGLAW
jgi:hypothetical protein